MSFVSISLSASSTTDLIAVLAKFQWPTDNLTDNLTDNVVPPGHCSCVNSSNLWWYLTPKLLLLDPGTQGPVTWDQEPEDQEPEDQEPKDQEPEDQEPEDQEPEDQEPKT